jgi:hypothetical protein
MEQEATALLASLAPEQREAGCFAFEDEATRRDWTYVPRQRPGLSLDAMDVAQQKLASRLLATALSIEGLATAAVIMALEDVLDQTEGGHRFRHRTDYSVAIFGPPGDDVWGWKFEGHHLSVNVTVVDGAVVSDAPLFFGANPAAIGTVRPLGPEEDLGRALARAAGDGVIISAAAPDDILTKDAPRLDGSVRPEGAALSSLTGEAARLARDLLDVYLRRLPEPRRPAAGALGDLHFAWAGSLEAGAGHYYRLQGRSFLVEYDNTQNGANHIHTVMRDTESDFGHDALRRHRAQDHHPPQPT